MVLFRLLLGMEIIHIVEISIHKFLIQRPGFQVRVTISSAQSMFLIPDVCAWSPT